MNSQKGNDEHADDDGGRQFFFFKPQVGPINQLFHALRRLKSAGGFENNADLLAALIKGGHVVFNRFVLTSVAFVFVAYTHQNAVHLFDDVFGQGHFLPRIENFIHQQSIAGDLLFITGTKRL